MTDANDECSLVGTEGYIPREGPGSVQADIFALGTALYEAATGMHRRDFPNLPQDLRDWPDAAAIFELNEIILRACAADPAERYQSATDMHADLVALRAGQSLKQRPFRAGWPRRLVLRGVAMAVTCLALVGVWQTINSVRQPRFDTHRTERGAEPRKAKARDAYRLGLLGMRRGTVEGFRAARDNVTLVTEMEPSFAPAYARLFETYLMNQDHGIGLIEGVAELLMEQAATLQRIAPTNAETYAARAVTLFLLDHQWDEAERDFKQALAVDPKCRMALTYYGYMLLCQRRLSEAQDKFDRAYELDSNPLLTKFFGRA